MTGSVCDSLMAIGIAVYLSDEWQPQQEAHNSNKQDQYLSGTRFPQLTWEQVCDGSAQTLHTHKL